MPPLPEVYLHTCIISFNRLHLTRQCIDSYLDTVTFPFSLTVMDNGSDEETVEWLRGFGEATPYDVVLLESNHYPGYATNRGWERASPSTQFLHRADNDFVFLPGWCSEVAARFIQDPDLGQLGLRTDEEELSAPWNVGGNCVVRRALWDEGLRWDERPWSELGATTEDYYLSQAVESMGHRWGRVQVPCIRPNSFEDRSDPYYAQSWGVRGI